MIIGGGAGFDKAAFTDEEGGPASKNASKNGFGHSGFTGTLAWADTENNLIYIYFYPIGFIQTQVIRNCLI